MSFLVGPRTTYENVLDHKESLANGLDFLNPKQDGIALLKKIGTNGFTVPNHVFSWTETDLAQRVEPVSTADGVVTALVVIDSGIYQVNDLIHVGFEYMRVTAITDGVTLEVERGYAGSTPETHVDADARNMGSADPENSLAPDSRTDQPRKLFNYIQTLSMAVEMSNDEIGTLSTDGNPLTGNLKRRFIEINRQLGTLLFYGVRYEDPTGKMRSFGGLNQFVTSFVTDVAGELAITDIDAEIKRIIDAGGTPNTLVMNTTQKQKLDALDNNLIRTGKETRMGGGGISQSWQSGVMDSTLEIIVDQSLNQDVVWVLDTNNIKIGTMSHNGVNGAFSVADATTPGQDGVKKVIRGKYSMRVDNEKSHARLYGLAV